MTIELDRIRHQIEAWALLYGDRAFAANQAFVPGKTYVPVTRKVIGGEEISNAVKAALDGWFTEGRWTDQFERGLARWFGVRHACFCNSGSSANLLALASLLSPLCPPAVRLSRGDAVLVAAAGFPTTLNPVLQLGLRPVFVDVELGTYVPSADMIESALRRHRSVRASFLAHTLGNPIPMEAFESIPTRSDGTRRMTVIEDNCDAVGAEYRGRRTGSIGELATLSFYPAHHISTGEGGAVLTSRPKLRAAVESLRDWGRSCWCAPGKDNTCGKRFGWDFPGLPEGYDHKYVYSHVGYNLKATDFQAAIGVAQLDRLDGFVEARRQNFAFLRSVLSNLEEWLILPEATAGASPSWFGFPLTLRAGSGLDRRPLLGYLEDRARVGTRLLFGGNLLRQPAYRGLLGDAPALPNSDVIAASTFWVGVWPGLSQAMLEHIAASVQEGIMAQINGRKKAHAH